MVTKETIGKIQIVIGILILIASLIGFYVAYQLNNNKYDSPYRPEGGYLQNTSISNETKMIILLEGTQLYLDELYFKGNIIINLNLFSIFGFILSLLFITQGLVNIGERNGE